MNPKEIKELIALMNENNLVELEIEREGNKIRLRKASSGNFETITEERAAPRIIQAIKTDQKPAEQKPESKLTPIKAPMVGTFYRTPAPDAKPYVEIGQVVEVGQVVCIIEAMKLMNEIKSEVKGKIVEILVENASPIEYGQALFMIEPTA
ncbi:MAG: acetyl-CoA carboxylase biotin carboxyl carrier protein [Candidatus Omnitrophota bacterium]